MHIRDAILNTVRQCYDMRSDSSMQGEYIARGLNVAYMFPLHFVIYSWRWVVRVPVWTECQPSLTCTHATVQTNSWCFRVIGFAALCSCSSSELNSVFLVDCDILVDIQMISCLSKPCRIYWKINKLSLHDQNPQDKFVI